MNLRSLVPATAVNEVIAKFCEDGLVESEVDGLISELDRVTFMVGMEGR